eukprot:scaffold3118_cov64-Cylindrotheca_fusiformis.AAC.6
MEERISLEKWEKDPMYFVYTSDTKDADIPKETLTHLRLDSSVKVIPDGAFAKCKVLVQVRLPKSLNRIGKSAFRACFNLKCIQFVSADGSLDATCSTDQNLEDGVLVFPERSMLLVDESAFAFCRSLRKVIVCSVATKLCALSFWDCSGLISVRLPEGLRVVEQGLFQSCRSLTTVQIPSSVIKIDALAFVGCQRLTSVDLPTGLLELGRSCFHECLSMESLDIPSTVSKIGNGAFCRCKRLVDIKLPATLEIVEADLLSDCYSLEYIEIPTTVKTIGDMAFCRCSSLSHIRIPPCVVHVGQSVFSGCSSLISLELPEGLILYEISECPSLVNLALPTLPVDQSYRGVFFQNVKIANVVDGYDDLRLKLKHRFDSSPLNKLCYYQAYHSAEDTMAKVGSLMDEDPSAATTQTDELGMTPLHILSLSQTPNLSMLLAVINGGHPDHIIRRRDSFGSTPMDYFCLNKMPTSSQVIGSLLQATILKSLDALGLDRWKSDVLQGIDEALAVDWSSRRRAIGVVYFKFADYVRKEILSLVELCLWRVKIDGVRSEDVAERQRCRINSGASIVIPNVLPFLDKLDMEDYIESAS